jgi:hypothetical protein
MRRKRLTSLKETDAFQQPTACEPSKLSKVRPTGQMKMKNHDGNAKIQSRNRTCPSREGVNREEVNGEKSKASVERLRKL